MQFKQQVIILLASIGALFALLYVTVLHQQPPRGNQLYVVCTTTFIADAIRNIATDTVHLDVLMGPGVDPHLYKPIEQDITKIAQADIIFYNGLHLEARMADLFASMDATKTTVAITKDIPRDRLITSPEHTQFFDPHIWFDPRLWSQAVQTISTTLQQHDPAHKNLYEQRTQNYLRKIEAMYESTKTLLHTIPVRQRILITAHDAFEYFSKAYDCQVVSLQGISTASEAGTKDVQKLANFIVQHKIPAIFIETSIPSRMLQAVQQNVQSQEFQVHIGQELYSDALGEPDTEQGTYIGMMNYNVRAIVNELLNSIIN